MVCGFYLYRGVALANVDFCPRRHERRVEFTGIHSGRLVEPHPDCGVDAIDHDLYLLQLPDRLRCTEQGGVLSTDLADRSFHLAFSHRGYR